MGAAYQNILYEVDAGIATITLNRPEKLNAISVEVGLQLYEAFARCESDSAIVLAGAGPCAPRERARLTGRRGSQGRAEAEDVEGPEGGATPARAQAACAPLIRTCSSA